MRSFTSRTAKPGWPEKASEIAEICKSDAFRKPGKHTESYVFLVNLHFGYELHPQKAPYFPFRKTRSLPQKGHLVLMASMCCCFSTSETFVNEDNLAHIACISSCEYKMGTLFKAALRWDSILGLRTITTEEVFCGTFLSSHLSEKTIYEENAVAGIFRYCEKKKLKIIIITV